MTTLILAEGWTRSYSVAKLREWCRLRLILEDDWEFEWPTTERAILRFRYEEDALAFRLAFGL